MRQIVLHLERHPESYPIQISQNALISPQFWSSIPFPSKRVVILADVSVYALYGIPLQAALTHLGLECISSTFSASELNKSIESVGHFFDFLCSNKVERRTTVIALGGGITGDTVGYVAASYLRGLPFIQVPTTLLAMVDASVGGKVGINLPQGKNLVGAFYQPLAVVIDPLVLKSLPDREFCAGLAECVKHAIIADESLFDWTAEQATKINQKDPSTLEELIERNVAIKARIVMADEREQGERALLNLGHTFAHALESETAYKWLLHGEAVALGLVAAGKLAELLQLSKSGICERIERMLQLLKLPIRVDQIPGLACPLSATTLLEKMKLDKKVIDSDIRFILPTSIGSAVIQTRVPSDAIAEAWKHIGA